MYKGPAGYFVPDGAVPVLAARDGKLWSIQRTARGWGIVLDHGPPWATYYQHLDSVSPDVAAMQRGAPIRAGQPLGVMGSDPTDGGHVRHLHFAVWYQGHGDQASVEPDMRTWRVAAFTMPDVAEV
jgi:murein DD-endopeptidase MepM/ murein hydrolase activator NlpD